MTSKGEWQLKRKWTFAPAQNPNRGFVSARKRTMTRRKQKKSKLGKKHTAGSANCHRLKIRKNRGMLRKKKENKLPGGAKGEQPQLRVSTIVKYSAALGVTVSGEKKKKKQTNKKNQPGGGGEKRKSTTGRILQPRYFLWGARPMSGGKKKRTWGGTILSKAPSEGVPLCGDNLGGGFSPCVRIKKQKNQ